MRVVRKEEFLEHTSYYRRILILHELGNLTPEEISVRVSGYRADHPDKIYSDILRLKNTLDETRLPGGYDSEFREIIGLRDELELVTSSSVSANLDRNGFTDEQRQKVETRVASSLETDEELGYQTDEAQAWFYRRLYATEVAQN